MDIYRKDMYLGGWFSFNCTKEDWLNFYAEKMFEAFFGQQYRFKFGNPFINEELLLTRNLPNNSLKNKKVLVVGGGPSSELLTDSIYDSYDSVITCNHFYKNSYLKNKKASIILLGDEVDLHDEVLLKYISKNNPAIGFEHSGSRNHHIFKNFLHNNNRCFLFLTRYFSRLGYVARGCVLARLLGAQKVDFIGMDGFSNNSHYFENNKQPPPFNNSDKFQKQAKIFFNYMIRDLGTKNFNNLGKNYEGSIYHGILEEVKNETN